MGTRLNYLNEWARGIAQAAGAGAFGGKPMGLRSIETVRGPRAGALEIDAGLNAGKMLRALSSDNHALHRQFIPWRFEGEPSVYMSSRFVRLEAGWPGDLAEKDIPLSSLGKYPVGDGRWIAGKNELGQTITLGLTDAVPHYLFGGFTGSGKTWAMRSAVTQLARDGRVRLVLADGKYGDGLGCLQGLPGLVGPMVTDIKDTRRALSWAIGEMRRRYETGEHATRLVVVIDEVQEFTQDDAIAEMLRRLTAQGRGAGVHCLVGTQNPLQAVFNDPSIKRNLVGRVALRTDSYKASEVVVGSNTPRADHLLGSGDSYALVPSATHRTQIAYIPEAHIPTGHAPDLEEWPDFDPESAGTLPDDKGKSCFEVGGKEMAVAILGASLGKGRPALQKMLESATGTRPGSVRAKRLLDMGRDGWRWLQSEGWVLCDDDAYDDVDYDDDSK